jgi:hypothetical protein
LDTRVDYGAYDPGDTAILQGPTINANNDISLSFDLTC